MTDKDKALEYFENLTKTLPMVWTDEAKAHLDALRDKPKEPEKKYFKGQYGLFWDSHTGKGEAKFGHLLGIDESEYRFQRDINQWFNYFEPVNDNPWQPQWIPRTGDECPFDGGQLVSLKFSGGSEIHKVTASAYSWCGVTHYAIWHETEWL